MNKSTNQVTHYCYVISMSSTLTIKWNGYRFYLFEKKETFWKFLSRVGRMNKQNVKVSWHWNIEEA